MKKVNNYKEFIEKTEKAIQYFDNAYLRLQNIRIYRIKLWRYHFKVEGNFLKHLISLNYNEKKQLLRKNVALLKRINRSLWFSDYNTQFSIIYYNSYLMELKASSNIFNKLYNSLNLTKEQHKENIIRLLEREEFITTQMIKESFQTNTQTTLVEKQDTIKQADVSKYPSQFGDLLFMIIFAVLSSALLFIFGEYYLTLLIRELAQWQIFVYIVLPIALLLLIIYIIYRYKKKKNKMNES